jgi:hypothetical protein
MTRLPAPRRRQRRARVLFAGGVLTVATGFVVGALLLRSGPALGGAAVAALAAGWVAARSLHAELLSTRRQHARERAELAQEARAMFCERSTQHAAFATFMTERLEARERDVREPHGTLRLSERRADEAERRLRLERRRADVAEYRVAELQEALAIRTAEEADELASWDAGSSGDPTGEVGTVIDLLAWEDRNLTLPGTPGRRRA